MQDQIMESEKGSAYLGNNATNNYQYKGDHSRAYNLAQAGGLYDARDYDIPRDQRDGVISKGCLG